MANGHNYRLIQFLKALPKEKTDFMAAIRQARKSLFKVAMLANQIYGRDSKQYWKLIKAINKLDNSWPKHEDAADRRARQLAFKSRVGKID